MALEGTASVIRAGTNTPVPLKVGDSIGTNDTILTGPDSRAYILFSDNTQFTIGENAKLLVDDYVFDPSGSTHNSSHYSILQGAFRYVSGLIAKKDTEDVNIDTEVGSLGIRGTEFIGKPNPAGNGLEIDLITGAVAFTPTGGAAGPTTSAPAQIEVSPSGIQVLPLTEDQYNTIEAQLELAAPTS